MRGQKIYELSLYPPSPQELVHLVRSLIFYKTIIINSFIEGIELEKERPHSPTNLSVVTTSSNYSYAQPQGLRDSLFKPIREVG